MKSVAAKRPEASGSFTQDAKTQDQKLHVSNSANGIVNHEIINHKNNLRLVRGYIVKASQQLTLELNELASRPPFCILHKTKKHDPL
jgi:hypothetical protein